MKTASLLVCVICLLSAASSLKAAEAALGIQLKGIVSASTNRWALLENEAAPPLLSEFILAEGQRDGNLEVLKIDAPAGKVTIKHSGSIRELALPEDAPSAKPLESSAGVLRLHQASLRHVFKLYQRFAQRSLIRSPSLPALELSLGVRGATAADLALAIEEALAKNGIIIKPDGDKFAVAAKEGEFAKIPPQLLQMASTLSQRHKPASSPSGDEMIPAGTINFLGLDLNQFLQVYQELTDRTILRGSSLAAAPIAFTTRTPLTMTEVIYALSVVLAMNDISVRPLDDKFLVVFPTAESNRVAGLLLSKAWAHAMSGKDLIPPGTLDFRSAKLGDVIRVYHDLTGQPTEMDDNLGRIWINLRTQTSLTRAETVRALDTVLGLNGITLVQEEDGKTLKVVRLGGRTSNKP